MRKKRIILSVVILLIILFSLLAVFGGRIQLWLKAGFGYDIIWEKSVKDYGATLYVLDTDDGLNNCAVKPIFGNKKSSSFLVSYTDEALTQLHGSRSFAENGKVHTEQLILFSKEINNAQDYTGGSFSYRGLTRFEISVIDDIFIVLCTTSTDKYTNEELFNIALSLAYSPIKPQGGQ